MMKTEKQIRAMRKKLQQELGSVRNKMDACKMGGFEYQIYTVTECKIMGAIDLIDWILKPKK